jgi:integrase
MHTPVTAPKVRFIRDMFVFSCFTGLAYIDLYNLSEQQLRKAPDGNLWINIFRQKSGVESHIRLLDIPVSIIEKYRQERKSDRVFNMPAHYVVIWHLRTLKKLCNISHLHFHMARHTFATEICLNNGVPMETLSKMMGHSSMRSTQIYGEITGKKVKKDMKKLSERIREKYHTDGNMMIES